MQEITAPLATLPDDPVPAVADVEFPSALRGYDRLAVDAYVQKTSQLVAELQATRSPDAAIRRALERVGEEVSGILQRAHEAAAQITFQSRSDAEDRLETARREAAQIVTAAEERVRELDAETDRIWAERHRIVEDTRDLARELLTLTDSAANSFPAEADGEDAPAEGAEAIEGVVAAPAEDDLMTDSGSDPERRVRRGRGGRRARGHLPGRARPARRADRGPPGGGAQRGRRRRVALVAARLIDVMHLGVPRVIGAWVVDDVVIDPGPTSCLRSLLEGLDGDRPRALLLTHIHLDHAGASGSLVQRWPDLEVYVHERGARHMADPERLIKSARMLYGEDMDRRWGEMVPVPEQNLRVLHGGEKLFDGAFEVAYTPGHASHHVSYLHDGTAFVGDTGGVRIASSSLTIPPSPPPDIDVERWHASIDLIRAWKPQRLVQTHFGWSDDPEAQLDELSARLDDFAARAREQDLDTFIAAVRAEIEEHADPELLEAYEQAAPPDQLYAGLERYWRKRAEAVAAG